MPADDKTPRLIFPRYRVQGNGHIRISEQEARFAFCSVLNDQREYFYAVECPTTQLYSFAGVGERSAQTDVSLFDNALSKVANVEFKAKMPSQKSFNKDIQKLVYERCNGCWFHLLENTNAGTLPALKRHLRAAFKEMPGLANQLVGNMGMNVDQENSLSPRFILITVCTLKTRDYQHYKLWGVSPEDFAEQAGVHLPE